MMLLETFPISCDLNETVLDEACNHLGAAALSEVKLYTTRHNAPNARRLQGAHGFDLVIVPDALMPTRYTWAVEFGGRLLGSPGCA